MFARFSVKKPYTVIVGVILVIVLGVVSFFNMRTDLLPNIDLPYVVVYTSYVGASPEQVETTVTKPMEAALASTTDLKSVQSVSSENVSMVVLEYEDGANMDTALIEISSAVSQIEGGWSDSVGSPVIMKLNPDMLPVMVASVDYEGMDIYELSEYVTGTLMTDMEGINGVASVETSGLIEQEITVTVRQSRIDAINNLILRDVDAELADVELELDEAQEALDDGKRQLKSAKKDALNEIDSMIKQLEDGSAQMPENVAKLEAQKKQLQTQRAQLVSAIEQLENSAGQQPTQEQIAGMQQLAQTIQTLESQKSQLQAQLDSMGTQEGAPTDEELAAQQKAVKELKAAVAANEKTIAEQQAYIDELSANSLTAEDKARIEQLQGEISRLNGQIAATEQTVAANAGEIEALQKQLNEQQTSVVNAEQKLAAAKAKEAEVIAAQAAVNAAQHQVTATESAIAQLKAELDALKLNLDAAQSDIDTKDAQLVAAYEQLVKDQNAVTAANEKLAKVSEGWTGTEVSEAQAAVDAAKAPMAETQAEIERMTQQNVTLRTEVTAAQNSIAEKQEELDALNGKAVSPEDQTKLESAQALLAEAQKALTENQAKLATAQQKLNEMQAAQGGDVTALKAQIVGIDAQLNAIKGSEEYQAYLMWQQMQNDPSAAEKQLAQLKGQLAQIDAGIAQLDSMIEKMNNGILPGGLVEGMDEDTNMADALEQLYAARETATSEFRSAENQISEGAEELASAREEFEKQRDEALENANINEMVTMEMVATIIGAQNISMPAGYVYEDTDEYLVRVGDKFGSVDELKNLVLFKMGLDSVDEVRLMDVATVEITDNSDEVFAIVNGNPAVTMNFSKQSTASTAEVSDEILETFERLSAENSSLHFTPLMDQGIYIDMIVDSVLSNLGTGAVLAIFILAIFLANLKPTIIIACAIPLSVVTALVCMYFSNITLNTISLSGLALAIGMLVDNAIVVIENIYRLRNEERMPILKACVYGTNQVAGALLSSTLTTICVFLPIVFVEGLTRQMFTDIALTIAYSLMASLLVALTLVPVMSAKLLRKRQREGKGGILRFVQKCYTGLLRVCLKVKILVLIPAIGLLVFAVMQLPDMGMILLENMSANQLSVTLNLSAETTFAEANEMCAELVDEYMQVEGIGSVGVMDGGLSITSLTSGSTDGNSRSFYIVMDEESGLTSYDVEQELYDRAAALGYDVDVNTNMMDLGALMGSGMEVQISGADTEVLQKIAADVAAMMGEIEGAIDIDDGSQEAVPQLSIVVDRAKASEYNLTVGQVMQTIALAINTGTSVTQMTIDGRELDVVVVEGENLERTPDDIGSLTMEVTTADGEEEIMISDICDIDYAMSLGSINRLDQRRTISVTCAADDEHNISLMGRELEEKLDAYELPEGYRLKIAGENESLNTMMEDMVLMIALAIVLIMLIMVAQFQSFFSPFIVLFTIPLAFTGGLLALYLLDMELSLTGMIGFLVLSGVVVNNGIVFVDSVNQMREAGMEKRAALIETGRIRLRPILMTALTTILGMLPMAMAQGMGAELMQSMAVVSIGGLSYATLMTLFVVPVLYDMFTGKKYKVRRIEDEDITTNA